MSSNFESWRDKVVLITGGSGGFGKVLGQTFARAGARVAITGRDPERLARAVDDLREMGSHAEGFVADVTHDGQVAQLFADVRQRLQRLDVLVNNVGRST